MRSAALGSAMVHPGIEIPPHIGRWVALRRVRMQDVQHLCSDWYTDSGLQVPAYVRRALSELLAQGHVRLGAFRVDGRSPVEVTESGDERFAVLDSPGGLG